MRSTSKRQKSIQMDRFNNIDGDKLKLPIPIGPRFQADVPEWMGPLRQNNESNYSKWLGVVTWPIKDATQNIEGCVPMKNTTPKSERCLIGKGRAESCDCTDPGSVLCVKHHISTESLHLQIVLGPAFQNWKFDQMGEGVAKLWKQHDQERLTLLIKNNSISKGQDFINLALECFPFKSKKDIVDFYFNVYIPNLTSIQTRSGCLMVNTDDEEDGSNNPSKRSRKKARVDCVTTYSPKLVKARYLSGRR